MTLQERVTASLAALGVRPDDPIAIACSGGADSIALVHLLADRGSRPVVLHVDHGLREDSAEDAAFVRRTASELGLAYAGRRVDVTPQDGSIEAGARRARYDALEAMAREAHMRYVLTAHTLDDQAETVLLRMMRGATLDAIAPANGLFVRPLLNIRRGELREWLEGNDIPWRDDPTNADTRFERNWVRANVMPELDVRRPGVAATLARVAERSRVDGEALDALAADVFSRAAIDDVGVFLPEADLALVPGAIASRVIRMAFQRLGTDPTYEAVDSVRSLDAKRFRFRDVDVWRLPDGLAFIRQPLRAPDAVEVPSSGSFDAPEWGIRVSVGDANARWRYAVTGDVAMIRSRRPGDRVSTRGGTKKVQDVLVDARVPRALRDLVPILEVDGSAAAVVGFSAPTSVSGRVVGIEPLGQSWSRELAWMGR